MFAERLKKLREEKGLTQQDIAEALGVGRATIAGYETKGKQPDHEKLRVLAKMLNTSIDYLLGLTSIKTPLSEQERAMQAKTYYNFDKSQLPDEAIKQIEEYIEFVKQKYNKDTSAKGKNK